jgi:fido (protein-threonine AMPylation protein)
VLDPGDLMTLHRRMFGDVWRWAGQSRQTVTTSGREDWWALREHLHQLLGNVQAQVDHKGRGPIVVEISQNQIGKFTCSP